MLIYSNDTGYLFCEFSYQFAIAVCANNIVKSTIAVLEMFFCINISFIPISPSQKSQAQDCFAPSIYNDYTPLNE